MFIIMHIEATSYNNLYLDKKTHLDTLNVLYFVYNLYYKLKSLNTTKNHVIQYQNKSSILGK